MQKDLKIETASQVEDQNAEEKEIDLLELWYALLDKWKYIALAAILGALLAGVYTFFMVTPKYEATSKIYVLNSGDSVVNLSDLQLGNYLASDYTELFNTWEVKETVRTNLGLKYTYEEMGKMVTVSNPQDTRILNITVNSADPQEAMTMANEYAKVISNFVSEIMATERPNTFSTAILPTKPVSPSKTRNVLLGFLLGMLLSMGIVVVHFLLDDSIKSVDDVTKYTKLPVLAVVPLQASLKEKQKSESRRKNK